ncbi:MAG TPA: hypothetical protein VFA90_08890 [Terriglobales bacterium]|nr:hypothetical protein [Terriglobales bacterium]
MTRKRTNPWALILVIIAVVILIALIAWVVLSKPQRSRSSMYQATSIQQTIANPTAGFDDIS